MADADHEQNEQRQRRTPIEDEDFVEVDEPPRRRQRVDPDEADEFDEWRSERKQRGRKRRRPGEDRRRHRDEWEEV